MRFHRLAFQCPRCQKPSVILAVSAAADSEIMVDLFCTKCTTTTIWKTDMMQMVIKAIRADQTEEANAPQIFDEAFLKACHVAQEPKLLEGGVQ